MMKNFIWYFCVQVHCSRRFYENLVPSSTIYDIDCPDNSFRKITEDGHFLITFSRNNQDLIVYRPRWPSFSYQEEDYTPDLPQKAKRFDSFFTELYSVSLASSNERVCKDFFIFVESYQFGLFATSTTPLQDTPALGEAVQGIPTVEKITFHLLRCVVLALNCEFLIYWKIFREKALLVLFLKDLFWYN